MEVTEKYKFRKATMGDLDLLMEWQSRPHVREWWDADEPYDDEEINDARVARWVVSTKARPFAFMQDYSTPRQHSAGDKQKLGNASKMGQRDIRRLLIIGAAAVIRWAMRKGAPECWRRNRACW